jgi:sarcosine oxidase subunit alpha
VLLIEEQERAGGSYLAHPAFGVAAADRALEGAVAAGVEVMFRASAFGWYPEDRATKDAAPGLLAVATPEGLCKLTADRYVYATGAYDQNALFADNDRPGVMSARAVGRLLVRFGVLPAEKPVVLGAGPYAQTLSDALSAAGAEVTRVDGVESRLTAAHGHSWVKAVDVETNGKSRRIKCDLVAVAALPAPASDLPRQHGVTVENRAEGGGFACRVDAEKSTNVRAIFACGDVTGFMGPERAAADGAQVPA